MIVANESTTPEIAYSLAIEKAEEMAKRYRRLAFWVPILSREFQIKANLWQLTVDRLKRHAATLGQGSRTKRKYERGELESVSIGPQAHSDAIF